MANSVEPAPEGAASLLLGRNTPSQLEDATSLSVSKVKRCHSWDRPQSGASSLDRIKAGRIPPSTPGPAKAQFPKDSTALDPSSPAMSSESSSPMVSLRSTTSSDTLDTMASSESFATSALASPIRRRSKAATGAGPLYVSAAPFDCEPAAAPSQAPLQRMSRVQTVNSHVSRGSAPRTTTVNSVSRLRAAATHTRPTVFRVQTMNNASATARPQSRPGTSGKQSKGGPTLNRVQTANSASGATVNSAGRPTGAGGHRGLGLRTATMAAFSSPGLSGSASGSELSTAGVPTGGEAAQIERAKMAVPNDKHALKVAPGLRQIRFGRAVTGRATALTPSEVQPSVNSAVAGQGLARATTTNTHVVPHGSTAVAADPGAEERRMAPMSGVLLSLKQRCQSIPASTALVEEGGKEGGGADEVLSSAQVATGATGASTDPKECPSGISKPLDHVAVSCASNGADAQIAHGPHGPHVAAISPAGKGRRRSISIGGPFRPQPSPGITPGAPHVPMPLLGTLPVAASAAAGTEPAARGSVEAGLPEESVAVLPLQQVDCLSTVGSTRAGSGGPTPRHEADTVLGESSSRGANTVTKADANQGLLHIPRSMARTLSVSSSTAYNAFASFRPRTAGPTRTRAPGTNADVASGQAKEGKKGQGKPRAEKAEGGERAQQTNPVEQERGEKHPTAKGCTDAAPFVQVKLSAGLGAPATVEESVLVGSAGAPPDVPSGKKPTLGRRILSGIRPSTAGGDLQAHHAQAGRLHRPQPWSSTLKEGNVTDGAKTPEQVQGGIPRGSAGVGAGRRGLGASLRGLLHLQGFRGSLSRPQGKETHMPITKAAKQQGHQGASTLTSTPGTPGSKGGSALGDGAGSPTEVATGEKGAQGVGEGTVGKGQGIECADGKESKGQLKVEGRQADKEVQEGVRDPEARGRSTDISEGEAEGKSGRGSEGEVEGDGGSGGGTSLKVTPSTAESDPLRTPLTSTPAGRGAPPGLGVWDTSDPSAAEHLAQAMKLLLDATRPVTAPGTPLNAAGDESCMAQGRDGSASAAEQLRVASELLLKASKELERQQERV